MMATLHEGRCTFLIIFRWFLLRTRNVLDRICRENHFVFNNIFPSENCAIYEIMWKMWYSRTGNRQHNTAHAQLLAGYPRLQTHSEYVILIACLVWAAVYGLAESGIQNEINSMIQNALRR
jgi:hypothetical protein